MSDTAAEQSLFDGIPIKNNIPAEPQIDESGADWSGDFEQLVDLIGAEAAWKIAEVYAGSTFYIPKSVLTNKNYFDIRRKYKSGSSYRELAVEFGYTEVHIRRIVHQKKEKV